MPVPPVELTVGIEVGRGDADVDAHLDAAVAAAQATGLRIQSLPRGLSLAGARDEVLAGLHAVLLGALDAGARHLELRVDAPTESRDD